MLCEDFPRRNLSYDPLLHVETLDFLPIGLFPHSTLSLPTKLDDSSWLT